MSQDLYSTLRRTADAIVAAYSSPQPWNPDQIWATRTDDCLHYIHPREAVPEAFRSAIDKNGHVQSLKFLGPVLERFRLDIEDAVIDVSTKTVVMRLTAKYDLLAVGSEKAERGLTTEFMWLAEMDESGEKVKRLEEFLDHSSFLELLIERAAKYAESQK